MKKLLFILLFLPCMVQGQNFRHVFSGYFGSNNTGTAGITSITAGDGLSGGTITTSGTISLDITSGVSDAMSGNFVIVTCTPCTTNSIIGITPKFDAAFLGVAVGSFIVRPLSGSFRIYQTNSDGLADGLTFMWYLIKP